MNPVIIILPEGATIGGVTSWSCSLGGELARLGRDVTLLVHGANAAHGAVRLDVTDGVRVEVVDDLATPREFGGDLGRVAEAYGAVARRAAERAGAEALLVPTRDADCFAACAMVAADGGARVIGWRHSPMAYEGAIFARYGATMTRMVGVSRWLSGELRRMRPTDAQRVGLVTNGVDVPEECPQRTLGGAGVRLIYTGRLDEPVKRVSALVAMSAELVRRGVRHVLTVVGDGPAEGALRAAFAGNDCVRFLGPVGPGEIERLLREHEVFVLGSRMEGLSLSALEAMAAGCALVLTRTPSGAADLVGNAEAGELAQVSEEADGGETGRVMAECVERLVGRGVTAVGRAAHARARRAFSLRAMGEAADRELRLAARAERVEIGRVEPFGDPRRPGSVPLDAGARLAEVLAAIDEGGVLVHGLGAHTMALAEQIAGDARVVALSDDDPARHGGLVLGKPVVSPGDAGATGARHVVISSWMHEAEIWARRGVYERQGLRVWRLYGDEEKRRAS